MTCAIEEIEEDDDIDLPRKRPIINNSNGSTYSKINNLLLHE